jgi:hypothetical protein
MARSRKGTGTRVVFVDIDGVLNSYRWFERSNQKLGLTGRELMKSRIDPAAVEHLNRILDRTASVSVLSSTWRALVPLPKLREVLREVGFRHLITDRTPLPSEHDTAVFERYKGRQPGTFEPYPRGYEIQQWLDAHPEVTSFVILDDDDDMEHLSPMLVRTDPYVGLTMNDAAKAIALLFCKPQRGGS